MLMSYVSAPVSASLFGFNVSVVHIPFLLIGPKPVEIKVEIGESTTL